MGQRTFHVRPWLIGFLGTGLLACGCLALALLLLAHGRAPSAGRETGLAPSHHRGGVRPHPTPPTPMRVVPVRINGASSADSNGPSNVDQDGEPAAMATVTTPAEVRRAAINYSRVFAQAKALGARYASAGVDLGSPTWSALGPEPQEWNPGSQVTSNSGRDTGIAIVSGSPDTIYLASASGGVWSAAADGASTVWSTTTDAEPDIAFGAIAVDPSDSSVVFAGTGEDNECADCYPGEGVLESTDTGSTWTLSNPGGIFTGLDVSTVLIEPGAVALSSTTVYVATSKGLFVSTDGGTSWAPESGAGWSDPVLDDYPQSGDVTSIVVNSDTTPYTLYAAVDLVGIEQSTDNGASWTTLSGSSLPAAADYGTTTLSLYTTSSTSTTTVYASVGGWDGAPAYIGLYKSMDGGTTWTALTTPNFTGTQSEYDNKVAVDPANPDVVFIGGVVTYESTDGGSTWVIPTTLNFVHVDCHALVFDNSDNLFMGMDGGAYELPAADVADTSGSANDLVDLNTNLDTIQMYAGVSVYDNGAEVLAGSQDNGIAQYTGSEPWGAPISGDGGQTAINPLDPNQMFGIVDGSLDMLTTSPSQSVTNISPPNQVGEGVWTAMAIVPNSSSPDSPTVYYGGIGGVGGAPGGMSGLWETTDPTASTPTWILVSTIGPVIAIAPAPSNSSVLYVAFGTGLYVTTDATSADPTFTQVAAFNTEPDYVTKIAVDPSDPTQVLVALSTSPVQDAFETGEVYQITAATTSPVATNVTGNLPAGVSANSVAYDGPSYVTATDVGVFGTSNLDGSNTVWGAIDNALPNVQVTGLTTDADGDLYAGTHGRGLWELSTPQHLVFTTQPPATSPANSDFDVAVTLENPSGEALTSDDSSELNLAITPDTGSLGAVLSCTPDTATTISGAASFSCSINEGGTYNLTATGPGLVPGVSTMVALPPSITVTESQASVEYGAEGATSFGVAVTGSGGVTPTGTVTIKDSATGDTICTTGDLQASGETGMAACSPGATALPGGTSLGSIYATYVGDHNDVATTTRPTLALAVTPGPDTVGLGESQTSVAYGDENADVFTATVTGASGGAGPSGSVTISDATTGDTICTVTALTRSPSDDQSSGTCSPGPTAFPASTVFSSIRASYAGDGNYLASTGGTEDLSVGKAATTITFTQAQSSSIPYGREATDIFSANVVGAAGGVSPGGTVTIEDSSSGDTICAITTFSPNDGSSFGQCTPSAAEFAGGTDFTTVVARYSGDGTYVASTSTPDQSFVVIAEQALVTLTQSSSSVTYGSENDDTFTVTIDGVSGGAAASGSVTILDGDSSTTICSVSSLTAEGSNASGTCTPTASAFGGGTSFSSIEASYLGDDDYSSAPTRPFQSFSVAKAGTSVTLSQSDSSVTYGAENADAISVVLIGAVGTAPTGPVTVKDSVSGDTLCSVTNLQTSGTDLDGSCSSTAAAFGGGTSFTSVVASYPGDANYASSTSTGESFSVAKASASITLSQNSVGSATYGDENDDVFTVTLTGVSGGSAPSGDVPVTDENTDTTLCTVTSLAPSGDDAAGTCSPSGSAFPVGTDFSTVVGAYAGDGNYDAAHSSDIAFQVQKGGAAVTLTQTEPSVDYGDENTDSFTVDVTGSGTTLPTGQVTISDQGSGTTLCQPRLTPGTNDSTAECSVAAAAFPGGTSFTTIFVSYGGDANYSAAESFTFQSFAVTPGAAGVSLTQSQPSLTYGSENNDVFSFSVTGVDGGAAPSGSVTVEDTATQKTICSDARLSTSGNVASGTCTAAAALLPGGTHITSVVASYGGDTNYAAASSSPGQSLTVAALGTTSTLTVSPMKVTYGDERPAVIEARVGTGTSTAASGTVEVSYGTHLLCAKALSDGSSSCPLGATTLAADSYPLVATFEANADFGSSSSHSATLVVSAEPTTTTLSFTRLAITYGDEEAETFEIATSGAERVTPAGTAEVRFGKVTVCSARLSDGKAHCSPTSKSLAVGTHDLTAVLVTSGDFAGSSSTAHSLKVVAAAKATRALGYALFAWF